MTQKVHCVKCSLYLGTSNKEDFPVQVTCVRCAATLARVKAILANEQEPDDWEPVDNDVLHLLRMLSSGLFDKVYEFPNPKWNGTAK